MAKKNRLSRFGPGFLVTAAFIGPGTVTTCSIAGADFGYSLLYVLIFATVTTIVLQEMTGRLSLGSGLDLGQSLREYPRNALLRIVFIILTVSAISLGCAAYQAGNIIGGSLGLEMVTSVSNKIWVLVISAASLILLSLKKYKIIEKVLISLVFLMSVSFITTLIIIKPDLSQVVKGLVPTVPENSIFIILALIGTTVVPYNLFLHSSAVKKKWKSPKNIKEFRKDLILSISLGGFISASIIITSSVAFFQKGIDINSGAQLAQQLKPLFGLLTNFLFGLGFFAAGMSSAVTAPYAAAFATSGVMGWKETDSRPFRFVWMGVILVGLIVSLFDFNPISVIVFAQVANGVILPVASLFLLIVLNDKNKMGIMANDFKKNLLGVAVISMVSLIGIWNIIKLFLR
ncbi:MAG: divalent metal cation transporter [Candidatus Aminicenantes bacterium]|nr:divalent metal cation transporter [Candidatus Aminicenantes bacterium]